MKSRSNLFCLAVFFATLLAGSHLQAVDTEPLLLPVSYSFKVPAGAGSLDVYDGLGAPNVGYYFGAAAESPVGTARLRPGIEYDLVFSGSGTTSYTVSLIAPGGYDFYVDGKPKDYIACTNGTSSYTDNYKIQLRPRSEGSLRAGTFTGFQIGQSVNWELGLGTTQAGKSVGRASFRELDLSSTPATRDRLSFTPRYDSEGVNLRWDGSPATRIRQIVSPRTMIDLVDVTDGYELRYYNYDDTTYHAYPALYTINGGATPYHTIFVEAPSGTSNELRITEKEESTVVRVSHLKLMSGTVSSGAYVWQLQEGGSGGSWLRTTTHTSTLPGGGVRENLVVVREGGTGGTIVSETKTIYHTYAWGEDVYQVIVNPNGGSGTVVTTTYDYYTTAPSSGDTYRGSYRRVKSISKSSGDWTAYEYYDDWDNRGQTKYVYRPYLDSPSSVTLDPAQGRVIYSTYAADASGRYRNPALRQEKINTVETAKTVWTYYNGGTPARVKADIDTFYATGGSSYLRTRSEHIDPILATDLDEAGEPCVVKNPDGTQTSWSRLNGDFNTSTRAFSNAGGSGIYWRIMKVNGTSVAGPSNDAEDSAQTSYDGQSFDAIFLVPHRSTMEITILDYAGVPMRSESRVYLGSSGWSDALSTNDYEYDFTRTNRLTGEASSNGATIAYSYNAEGRLSSRTGSDGVVTGYTYDALGRTLTVTKAEADTSGIHEEQAEITTTYNYDSTDGANYAIIETLEAAGETETIESKKAFDRAGRVVKVLPAGLDPTIISYNEAARTQTSTAPDGGTTIQENFRDGTPKKTTGTAVVEQHLSYGVETDGRQYSQVNSGSSGSARLQKSWVDWLGRKIKSTKPGFSQSSQAAYVEEQFYDGTTGQLIKSTRTGMGDTLYGYDALGRIKQTGLDVINSTYVTGGSLVLASDDRITESDSFFEQDLSDHWWAKTTSTTYPDAGASTHPITTSSKTRLSNFPSGVRAESQSTDAEGNTVTTITSISGQLITTETSVSGLANDQYEYVYNGKASASTGHDGLTTKIKYDKLGRQQEVKDARGLATTTAYHTGTTMVDTVTDSASNVVSKFWYTDAGRVAWSQDADDKYTRFEYNLRGQVIRQWGDGTYPVSYTYDGTYGDRIGMSTYRSAPPNDSETWPAVGTADTTTWDYDPPSGLLWKKTDAAGEYVAMDYDEAGRTSRRTLARGVYTNYGYHSATGELLTLTYSDSTPDVTYTYTRLGQVDSVTDGVGDWDLHYDTAKPWRHEFTELPDPFYGTRFQTIQYEASGMVGRYLGFKIGSSNGSSADLEQTYAYSTNGRFHTLASKRNNNTVTRTFEYSYLLTGTPFVTDLAIQGGHNFTVERNYDSSRNLLTSIESKWGGTPVTRYDYAHNALGQRTTAKQSGSAFGDYYAGRSYSAVFNHYTYNARGELASAAMYKGDTPTTSPLPGDELPGRRFEYRFDSIGNRKTDGPTGAANGVDDQYLTNNLNQYTDKENNTVRVIGTVSASATGVAVEGALSTGKNDNAWGADFVPPNSEAVKGTVTVYASEVGGGTNKIRTEPKGYFIPKAGQEFEYDEDGNLTTDGIWHYYYDAENRLYAMQNEEDAIDDATKIPEAAARRLEFKYDYQGRRVRKTVYGGWDPVTKLYSGTAITDTKYLYDGWNLVAEFNAISTLTLTKIYTWGLDLTGSLTASGGVGGLIQIYDASASKTLLPTYDGNGNVAALLNAETGGTLTLEAAYEYDPFGNLLRNEGSYAATNTFRFSSKFVDLESGLTYFGYRFYSPSMGRFINQDPISESGGLNLYGFCSNNSVNSWDYLGMYVFAPRSGWNLFEEAGNTGQATGGGTVGSLGWAWGTGLGVAVSDMDSLLDSMTRGVGAGVPAGVTPARENRAVVSAADLRALQDRETLTSLGVDTSNMGNGQVLDLAVLAGVSNSVQQVNPGTQLNGFSMALIGISMGMVSPLMALTDAIDNPSLLSPLNIAFSTIAGAGAIAGAPASLLTGDAFDSYTVAGSGRAYMNGIFTSSEVGAKVATEIGAAYLNNNSHYFKIGDIAQILLDTAGVITAPSINATLSAGAGASQFVLHSQGTATGANGLRLVPAGMRSGIDVVGMGGQWHLNAAVLGYRSATNITASLDPVPYLSPNNYPSRVLSGATTTNRSVPNAVNKLSIRNHDVYNYTPYIPPIEP